MRIRVPSTQLSFAVATGMITVAAMPLHAQDMNGPDRVAVGVAAYAASKDLCEYQPIVGTTIDQIDRFFQDNYGIRWELAKERGAAMLGPLQNLATALDGKGSADNCKALGIPVGDALVAGVLAVGPNPEVFKEADRLSGGGGRKRAAARQSSGGTAIQPAPVQPTADLSLVAKDAEAAMREVLARDLSGITTDEDRLRLNAQYLTPELAELLRRSAQSFDVDPFTGSHQQDKFGLKSLSSSASDQNNATVMASLDNVNKADETTRITYSLVRSETRWLIRDVRYLDNDSRSIRSFLK